MLVGFDVFFVFMLTPVFMLPVTYSSRPFWCLLGYRFVKWMFVTNFPIMVKKSLPAQTCNMSNQPSNKGAGNISPLTCQHPKTQHAPCSRVTRLFSMAPCKHTLDGVFLFGKSFEVFTHTTCIDALCTCIYTSTCFSSLLVQMLRKHGVSFSQKSRRTVTICSPLPTGAVN